MPLRGFCAPYLPGDPPHYSDCTGNRPMTTTDLNVIPPREGYEWAEPWKVDSSDKKLQCDTIFENIVVTSCLLLD